MKEIESIANQLFDKIRTRFDQVTLGDSQAKATTRPEKAKFFNFEYSDDSDESSDEENESYGKVVISLIDEKSLKVYYGQDIAHSMPDTVRRNWYEFLRGLKSFARRNFLAFDVRDINKSKLELRDIIQQTKDKEVKSADDIVISEGRMYGTSKTSYLNIGECRLSIKHSSIIDESKIGARSRRIHQIFLETAEGERFRMPKNLTGACALARHVSEGGQLHDDRGTHITKLIEEMTALRKFVNATRSRQFDDQETADMTTAARGRHNDVKITLRQIGAPRGYHRYFEDLYHDHNDEIDDYDINEMRERFTKKIFDDRLTDALPYVARAYKNQSMRDHGIDEIEDWANAVTESAYDMVDSDEKFEKLQDLMSQSMPVGIDGIDAQNDIDEIIGDDDLNDALYHLAQDRGPDADARPLIKDWIRKNQPKLLDKLEFGDKDSQDAETDNIMPSQDHQPDNDKYGTSPSHPNVSNMTQESIDSMQSIRKLAGLV
jgi:hypothetical protein